jgi:hypothetical protein
VDRQPDRTEELDRGSARVRGKRGRYEGASTGKQEGAPITTN